MFLLSSAFKAAIGLAMATQIIAGPTPAKFANNASVSHWLYTSQLTDEALTLLGRKDIEGVQTLYGWRALEPERGIYDFSLIHRDLKTVRAKGKQLWVQVQDRTFNPQNIGVPDYLKIPQYSNGSAPQCDGDDCEKNFIVGGWVAAHWNEDVRGRFQALLDAMARELDGLVYGVNLAETSIGMAYDPVTEANPETGFSCKAYFEGQMENAAFAASAFKKSFTVQYINFWPCEWKNDHNYMKDAFDIMEQNGIGAGGPDDIPYNPAHVNNAYPFMSEYRSKVPINVVAVQEPTLKKINPKTSKPFTKKEFVDYAVNELGSQIMFWALSSPWLRE